MATAPARGWSKWWWDVTVWGTIMAATLVHALLYGWREEHTLPVVLIGLWVGFSLVQIWRGRHQAPDSPFSDEAVRKPSSTDAGGVNRWGWTALLRPIALVGLAIVVVVMLSSGNLTVPTAALGAWVAMELVEWRNRKDPIEQRPPDPSLHHATRRN